jgi:hypothetical protein
MQDSACRDNNRELAAVGMHLEECTLRVDFGFATYVVVSPQSFSIAWTAGDRRI